MKKSGFKPIIDNNTEILILGTMPGDRSIQTGEYYANSKNQFWKIIFKIFNNGKSEFDYSKKTKLLLKNKIGLWDVLTSAEREGSLDSNIHREEFNDFNKLFSEFPNLRIIVFNGKKAAEYFKGFKSIPKDKEYYILPSTSSANTWQTFEQKYMEWKEILKNTVANKGS
jgi:hypoxanthine-DNA glycosylase